jgi:hypothetical protein
LIPEKLSGNDTAIRGTRKNRPSISHNRVTRILCLEKLAIPITIKIIGQEKIIGLHTGFIQPKLKERKSTPAITSNNPNKIPFNLGEGED